MTLASVLTGYATGADICFLVAFILFVVLAVIALTRQATESALNHVAFALVALGFLLL